MMTYQLTTAVLGIAITVCILFLVRRGHLHGPYAIWWLLVALLVTILGIWPTIVDAIGRQLGVSYPPALLLVLAQGMMLVKILTMDVERSRQERRLRRLAQQMAILEALIENQQQTKENSRDEV